MKHLDASLTAPELSLNTWTSLIQQVLVLPSQSAELDQATSSAYRAALLSIAAGVFLALLVASVMRAPRPKLHQHDLAIPGLIPREHGGKLFFNLSWSPDIRDARDRGTMPVFQSKTPGQGARLDEQVARVSGSLLVGSELRFRGVNGNTLPWAISRRTQGGFEVTADGDTVYEVWKAGHERWTVDGTLGLYGSFAHPDFLTGHGFIKVFLGNMIVAQVEVSNDDERGRAFHVSIHSSADICLVLASVVSLAELEAITLHAGEDQP
jgi:hypothetical protein